MPCLAARRTNCRVKRGTNAKPVVLLIKKENRRILKILGVFVVLSFVYTLISFSNNTDNDQLETTNRIRRKSGRNNKTKKMDCSNLERIKICSHQLLNPPSGKDGSVSAMTALWEAGITCFDIDVVTMKDGELLASHPSRFAAGMMKKDFKSLKPEDYTLDEAREAGVDIETFPLLKDLLLRYAFLINRKKKAVKSPFYRQHSQYLHGPLLNLDLKRPNLTKNHLQTIQKLIIHFGIQDNVVICVTALKEGDVGPGIDILQELGHSEGLSQVKLKLGLALRDRERQDWDIDRIHSVIKENFAIQAFITSYKFTKDWFDLLQDLPVVVWTVDGEEALLYAMQSSVAAVISNDPLELLPLLKRYLEEAKCRV